MRRYLMFILASILPAVVVFYWWMSHLSFNANPIYYGLIIFYRETALNVMFITFLSFFVFLVGGLFVYQYLNSSLRAAYILAIFLLFVSVPLSCLAASFNFIEFGTSFTHLSRAKYGDHLYQLALIYSYGVGSTADYNFYRCDSLGLVCERIHQIELETDGYNPASRAYLMYDPDTVTLSIQLGQENLYTYHP